MMFRAIFFGHRHIHVSLSQIISYYSILKTKTGGLYTFVINQSLDEFNYSKTLLSNLNAPVIYNDRYKKITKHQLLQISVPLTSSRKTNLTLNLYTNDVIIYEYQNTQINPVRRERRCNNYPIQPPKQSLECSGCIRVSVNTPSANTMGNRIASMHLVRSSYPSKWQSQPVVCTGDERERI